MGLNQTVHSKAIDLGKEVIRMTTAAGSGHPSSALSIIHIVITLMETVMRWDKADPWHPGSDRLVLSEGHAVPAVYAAYADMGGTVGREKASARPLTRADLASLRDVASPLDGHPNPAEGFPFFDAATGSLGQGLSVAAGLALAARLAGSDRQVFTLIGDGESREGQIWEAMDFIADHKLTSVVAFFNCNGQGQADNVSHQQSAESLARKAEAFGWKAVTIDGHDADAIVSAIGDPAKRDRPVAIIAKTQKGWGCESLKDKGNHGKPIAAAQLEKALGELDAMATKLEITGAPERLAPALPAAPKHTPKSGSASPAPFNAAMEAVGLGAAVAKNQVATRRAYGAALVALGAADDRIVALDGDVRNSTFSELFMAKFPDRFFECKIAEQNMISAAAGLSAAGYIPFASTFAKFLARGYDQIEMAQITRANIKLVGSHSGVSLAADGPSQMSLHDIAYFRSASQTDNGRGGPVCVTLHPSDAVSAYHCTWLMARHDGMCYLRTHRPEVPLLYAPDTQFTIGGSHTLMQGDALTLVSAGYMVHVCKQAADELAKQGIKCTLIDAYSLPLDAKPILAHAQRTGGRILTVEDNYIGGLAGAIAESAAESGAIRVHSMTCKKMPRSARSTDEIMAYVGLSTKHIADKVQAILR
jgi:transketolase